MGVFSTSILEMIKRLCAQHYNMLDFLSRILRPRGSLGAKKIIKEPASSVYEIYKTDTNQTVGIAISEFEGTQDTSGRAKIGADSTALDATVEVARKLDGTGKLKVFLNEEIVKTLVPVGEPLKNKVESAFSEIGIKPEKMDITQVPQNQSFPISGAFAMTTTATETYLKPIPSGVFAARDNKN